MKVIVLPICKAGLLDQIIEEMIASKKNVEIDFDSDEGPTIQNEEVIKTFHLGDKWIDEWGS